MGLFRRGTKLLKLGGGLRDCCCRPEKPEECWCPDWCRYSWSVPAGGWHAGGSLLKNRCTGPTTSELQEAIPGYPYGMLGSANSFYLGSPTRVVRSGYTLNPSAIWLRFFHAQGGTLSGDVAAQVGTSVGGYFTSVSVRVFCEYNFGTTPKESPLILDVNVQQTVFADTALGRVKIYASSLYAGGVLDSACQVNSRLFCNAEDPASSKRAGHLLGDTGVSITPDSVVAGEQEFEWYQSPLEWNDPLFNSPGVGLYESENITTATTGWEVSGDYPFSRNITLQAADSCLPSAPCDCTQSLNGMLVEFEGQTFTYGDLEEFFSEDGGTRWVESSAGLFYRYDYDPCDYSQQFIANQKTANVFCTNEGGEDFWGVVLTNECYERSSCGGGYDATRGMQWSGLFDCVDGGGPQGQPQQPLALVYDIPSSAPAPSGVCVGTLAIPEFEFLAP